MVTAGFRCAALLPQAIAVKTPAITANAQPAVITIHPLPSAFDRFSTTPATTPSPSKTSIMVPRNSLSLAGRISRNHDACLTWRRSGGRRCAEAIESGRQRVDGDYRWLGVRRDGGSFYRNRLWKQRGASEPCGNHGNGRAQRKLPQCFAVRGCTDPLSNDRSHAGVAALSSALDRDDRRGR